MTQKPSKRLYLITALILATASAIPVWHFVMMISWHFGYGWLSYNVVAVVPFMAVSVTILLGFLLMPLLRSYSRRINHLFIFLFAVMVFSGLSLIAEAFVVSAEMRHISLAPDGYIMPRILLYSRMMRPPSEILAPNEILAYAITTTIPPAVRIHYYIFSIALITSVLSWLHNIAQTVYVDGRPGRRFVAIQGIATAGYILAYIMVRAVQFENLAALRLTPASVVNSAVCFVLASVVMGLWGISCFGFAKRARILPPMIAVLTVLLLYAAQFFMLGGQFYLYVQNSLVTFLIQVLIAVIPGIFVYLLLRCRAKPIK